MSVVMEDHHVYIGLHLFLATAHEAQDNLEIERLPGFCRILCSNERLRMIVAPGFIPFATPVSFFWILFTYYPASPFG